MALLFEFSWLEFGWLEFVQLGCAADRDEAGRGLATAVTIEVIAAPGEAGFKRC
jgi:hypothetical protein